MNSTVKKLAMAIPPLARLVAQRDQLVEEANNQRKLIYKLDETNKLLHTHQGLFTNAREVVAQRYLSGDGLEIGALHLPLPLPPAARVRYVDRMPVKELRRHYPEMADKPLVDIDVIDDGGKLTTIGEDSVDFVVANHLLEHMADPIGAILNMLRVVKPGGVLFITVPDKRYTFDKDKPVTSVEHMIRDYEEGPDWSREGHYKEWVKHDLPDRDKAVQEKRALELMDEDYSIHFHIWTVDDFYDLLQAARQKSKSRLEIVFLMTYETEVIAVMRKCDLPPPAV